MTTFDRALCGSAGILGLATFAAGVRYGRSWAIAVGIVALLVGLTAASLMARRAR